MIKLSKIYFCSTCNKQLDYLELCSIVGHTQMSCKYCHTDIKTSYQSKVCPYGHNYNKDVDKTPDCDYCIRWEDCINNGTKN